MQYYITTSDRVYADGEIEYKIVLTSKNKNLINLVERIFRFIAETTTKTEEQKEELKELKKALDRPTLIRNDIWVVEETLDQVETDNPELKEEISKATDSLQRIKYYYAKHKESDNK